MMQNGYNEVWEMMELFIEHHYNGYFHVPNGYFSKLPTATLVLQKKKKLKVKVAVTNSD